MGGGLNPSLAGTTSPTMPKHWRLELPKTGLNPSLAGTTSPTSGEFTDYEIVGAKS